MNSRIFYVLLILTICSLLSSCASFKQVDNLGIVITMAVDMEEDEVIVTSQIMSPMDSASKRKSGTSDGNIKFVQSRGKTIIDALKNASLNYDGDLFLPHNSIIIFGEDLAKRGIGEMINFFSYDIGTRETTYLLVANGSKAYEILGLPVITDDYLLTLIQNSHFTAKTRSLNLTEYIRYYFSYGTPVLGVVRIMEKIQIEDVKKKSSPIEKVLDISGGAAFYKDMLQGYYSGEEMIGFNFLVDEIKKSPIVFETPDELTKGSKLYSTRGRYSVINIMKSKTKLSMEIRDNKPHLIIDVNMKGSLDEETKGLNVPDKSVRKGIEDACSAEIEKLIKMTMDKAQKEFRMDTFSIGDVLHREYPQVWKEVSKDWNEVFSDIDYTVNVETTIIRTGIIDLPINIRKGRE